MSTTVTPQRRGRGCITAAAIGLIVAVVAAALILSRPALFSRGEQTITSEAIGASFGDIAELSTEEYVFTKAGTFDEAGFRIAGRTVPFTGKKFVVTYEGRVTAGIRDAELIDATINDRDRTLTITSPRPELLDSTIDPDSITVLDQTLNPINQVTVGDVSGFLADQEKAVEEEAVEKGIVDRASAHAEELLRSHGEAVKEGTQIADYTVVVQFS